VLVLLAFLAIGNEVREWHAPSAPSFEGRLAWLVEAAFALAGSTAFVILWVLLLVEVLVTARFVGAILQSCPRPMAVVDTC
jgi:hypothetical protein